jgi:hypothetical protein
VSDRELLLLTFGLPILWFLFLAAALIYRLSQP